MTGIEIVVLIVGIIFVLGSFFVGDKLSSKDVDQIALLSREQLNRIVEKELQHANSQIQNTVDETIENSVLKIERMMDKEANQKMMSISEYSDTVLGEINKAHTEIMFLYSMLNDKQQELSDMTSHLSKIILDAESAGNAQANFILPKVDDVTTLIEPEVDNDSMNHPLKSYEDVSTDEDRNQNHKILSLAQNGALPIEIAKQLNVGIGEVRFVLDLYKGE